MSFSSWINPFPTIETLQVAQKKHSLCQASVSKATNRVLPSPPLPILIVISRTKGSVLVRQQTHKLQDNKINCKKTVGLDHFVLCSWLFNSTLHKAATQICKYSGISSSWMKIRHVGYYYMQHNNANNHGFRECQLQFTFYVFIYIRYNACCLLLAMIQDDKNKLSIIRIWV